VSPGEAVTLGPTESAVMRRELHERLLATFDFVTAAKLSREDLIAQCSARIQELLDRSGHTVSEDFRAQMVQGVLDDIFGLGPLEPLFADDEITDILVVGADRVFVERRGMLQESGAKFRDNAHLMHVIQRIVRNAGRRIDERSPMVDARLPDGSRVNAIIPPLAVDGAQLSIRRFPARALGLDWLVERGSLHVATANLLRAAVAGRLNIIICGGAGAGKTTLLNAASASLGARERVITIEDAAELRLEGAHVVRLETRAANVEGVGVVAASDLLRNALRMRPDRIIVGECRGAEAFDMMQAMNTGHEGSMTTLHANSARDALHRLESMLAMGGMNMPMRVLRDYVASAINLVVHVTRLPDGRRVVSEVCEVDSATDDGVNIRMLHTFRLVRVQGDHVEGVFEATGNTPNFLSRLAARGITLDSKTFAAGPLSAEPSA
jgi:pilus assembly protein CpaF